VEGARIDGLGESKTFHTVRIAGKRRHCVLGGLCSNADAFQEGTKQEAEAKQGTDYDVPRVSIEPRRQRWRNHPTAGHPEGGSGHGLRAKAATGDPADLAVVMRRGPVAIFGNYLNTPGTAYLHATVAYKLAGNLASTMDLWIHGFDPQMAESQGSPYKNSFMSFHDPLTPNMSMCRKIDYFMYC
jgi:hypothetical protein